MFWRFRQAGRTSDPGRQGFADRRGQRVSGEGCADTGRLFSFRHGDADRAFSTLKLDGARALDIGRERAQAGEAQCVGKRC